MCPLFLWWEAWQQAGRHGARGEAESSLFRSEAAKRRLCTTLGVAWPQSLPLQWHTSFNRAILTSTPTRTYLLTVSLPWANYSNTWVYGAISIQTTSQSWLSFTKAIHIVFWHKVSQWDLNSPKCLLRDTEATTGTTLDSIFPLCVWFIGI